jgi:chromosome segregation protein
MILVNPENLAETGIEIIAKPKGKRPSSITQLSGGEKTLRQQLCCSLST